MTASDARILLQMLRGQPSRGSHAQRLEAFYAPQADRYDAFRERLLHGRRDLVAMLDVAAGAHVVELGGGTGRNLLFFGEHLDRLGRVDLVDLCPALLELARRRNRARENVRVFEADAVTWRPEAAVDGVYFAYSLTMIPDWSAALDNALAMLKPGGVLGVVDFYVSGPRPGAGRRRHGALSRLFWPRWFRHDGVRLSPHHLDRLTALIPDHRVLERTAPVPYLPGLRVPYYLFVGKKSTTTA